MPASQPSFILVQDQFITHTSRGLIFTEDSRELWIAVTEHGKGVKVQVHSVPSLELRGEIVNEHRYFEGMAYNPSQRLIAIYGSAGVHFFDAASLQRIPIFKEFEQGVYSGLFTADGGVFLGMAGLGQIWKFDLQTLEVTPSLDLGEGTGPLIMGASGDILLIPEGSQSGSSLNFATLNGSDIQLWPFNWDMAHYRWGAAVNCDGTLLAMSDGTLALYELPSLEEWMRFDADGAVVLANWDSLQNGHFQDDDSRWSDPVFSPCGTLLACKSSSSEIFIWKVQTGELIQRIPVEDTGYSWFCFNRDTTYFACATNYDKLLLFAREG